MHPSSLTEKAYQLLLEEIVTLGLPPGSLINEGEVRRRFNLGRTPLREALTRLAAEGLVVHVPHRGMWVADITAADLQKIHSFRSLIEGEAARLAAQNITEAQIEQLLAIHRTIEAAVERADLGMFMAQDRCFHQLLGEASQNEYIQEAVARIYNLHFRLWYYLYTRSGGLRETATEHLAMIEAIGRRDPEAARASIMEYIGRIHAHLKQVL